MMGREGEAWQLRAGLRVGTMGFEESYESDVRLVKWRSITVRLVSSRFPLLLPLPSTVLRSFADGDAMRWTTR